MSTWLVERSFGCGVVRSRRVQHIICSCYATFCRTSQLDRMRVQTAVRALFLWPSVVWVLDRVYDSWCVWYGCYGGQEWRRRAAN